MMGKVEVDEFLVTHGADDVEILTCDGFDDAFLGVVERFNQQPLALYDKEKMLSIMVQRDEMTYEQALEFFDYNVQGAWAGEGTPAFATLAVRPSLAPVDYEEPDMPLL